jgi:hypothetical protein
MGRDVGVCQAPAATLQDPDLRAKLSEVCLPRPVGSTPSELAAFLAREIEKFPPSAPQRLLGFQVIQKMLCFSPFPGPIC